MPDAVALDLEFANFRQRIRTISDVHVPRATASAINKTSFEILIQERREALRAFRSATPRGKQLVGGKGAFRFTPATPSFLEARIFPMPGPQGRRARMLREHYAGETITGREGHRLGIKSRGSLAVPIGLARGERRRSGMIPKKYTPAFVLSEKGRGFWMGESIRLRLGRKKTSRTAKLYAVVPKARLERRFDFYIVARDTARRELPRKMRYVLAKIRG